MDPEIKQKWLTALRSGDYIQTTHKLKCMTRNEFCCLGVLCDIQGPIEWKKPAEGPKNINVTPHGIPYYQFGFYSIPPKYAAGITTGQQEALVDMNDAGATFEQIADWIEESL